MDEWVARVAGYGLAVIVGHFAIRPVVDRLWTGLGWSKGSRNENGSLVWACPLLYWWQRTSSRGSLIITKSRENSFNKSSGQCLTARSTGPLARIRSPRPVNAGVRRGTCEYPACPASFDVLNCGLWRTGFGLRRRQRSTSRNLPLDNNRRCLML